MGVGKGGGGRGESKGSNSAGSRVGGGGGSQLLRSHRIRHWWQQRIRREILAHGMRARIEVVLGAHNKRYCNFPVLVRQCGLFLHGTYLSSTILNYP